MHTRPVFRIRNILAILLVLGMLASYIGPPAYAQDTVLPTITTDKSDYAPGWPVILTGTGWAPGEDVYIVVNDTINQSWQHVADVIASGTGTFTYEFTLPTYFVSDYDVTAKGPISGTATTTFTDANPAANLDQWANIDNAWVNGNLGPSKSIYYEGDSIPYRLRFTNLNSGSHTVTIEWDTTQNSKHALDYLTSFDRTASPDPCSGVSGCSASTTYPIPDDPQVTGAGVTPVPDSVFTFYGATITNVSAYSYPNGTGFSGNMSAQITITFNTSIANPVLAWGGHISDRADWGADNSAVAISGSPYHTRLIDLDGSGGNQDRSLSAAAVIFPGSITIVKDAVPDSSTVFNFTASPSPLTNFSLVDDGTSTNTKLFSNITSFTTYTVNETVLSNWPLTDITCVVSSPNGGTQTESATGVSIDLKEGENVTCTFTDTETITPQAALTVDKVLDPSDDPGLFNLVIDGTVEASDVGNGGTTGAVTVAPGDHTVSETAGTGTNLGDYDTSWACTINGNAGPSGTGTSISGLMINDGDTVACTFTNTRKGNIVIKKVTDPSGQSGDFSFTGAVSGTIQDGGTLTASNLAPGNYTVTESSLASDFESESIVCDDTNSTGDISTRTASITLDPGETVTCTFTNKKLSPDLAVTKTADAGIVTAGDAVGFSIDVKNNGQGTAYNVTLSDTLPAIPGVTWAIASQPSGDPCTLTGNSLTCSFGNLAPGASTGPVHITGTSAANSCGTWNNTATAQADNNAPVTGSDSILVDCATIEITKTTSTPVVSAGDPIDFTITVTNSGDGTAHNVTVTDTLPANAGLGAWTLSGTDASACSISSGVLTCNFGDLAAQASKTVTLTASTTAATCGTVSNTASVTTGNDGDATTPDTVITVQCPNLSVTKTPDAASVNADDPVGFTITVHNAGPGVAKSVILTDALPAGLTWTSTPGEPTCTITGQDLSCNLGDLASGADASVHVSATSTPTTCGPLSNTATATPTNGAAASSGPATITVNCADVTVTKTGNGPVSAGDTATFTITVSVTGSGSLSNVTLSDPLPADVTWAIDPSITACSISGSPQVLNCAWATLAAGTTIEIAVSGTTSQSNCSAPLNNTATVAAANETDTTNDTASASIEVDCASIQIEKTTSTPTVSAGDPISYTITVTNPGVGIARNVTVTDNLPAGAGLNWSYPASCSVSGGVLTCNLGDIAGGGSKSITLTSPTTAATCGTISNSASVTTSNDGSGTSTPVTEITVECPNLSVTKTPDAASVSAGDTVGFTITVSNAGPGEAKGVMISDSLPGGLAWTVDAGNTTASNCLITGGVLTCGPDTIASGASIKVHITAVSTPAVCGTLSNTATATPTNGDAATSQSSDITVLCPDLIVTKSGNGPISAGDTATFTIEVKNIGPGEAKSVTLTDTLPGGLTWSLDPVDPACSITGTTTQILSCSWATLASNASVAVTVSTVTSKDNCGTLTNSASVSATNEANTSNNSSGNVDLEVDCATIQIEKTTSTPTVSAGDPISYTITVSNPGLGIARNVTVTDTLPASTGLSWTIDPAVSGCSISSNALTCNFGDIASGGSKSVTLTSPTTAATCGTISNVASVTTTNDGFATTPDTVITVNCPDLTVTKTGNGPVNSGDTAIFIITITNNGTGDAKGVTLSDQLPAGVSWSVDNASCSIDSNNLLSCSFGTLAAGASITIHVSGTVPPAVCGLLNNTVTVAATNEADTSNNSATGSVTVNCASISITKTAPSPISAGDTLIYTLTVSNTGTGTAYGVTVTDTLPTNTGLGPWTVTPGDPTCTVTAGVLNCSLGDMPAGSSQTITISSPTTYATCGTIFNEASVNTTNDGSGKADTNVVVQCPALEVAKTPDAATVSAGDPIGFTITVTNTGDGTAKNVTLNDTLPTATGISWSISPAVTGCSISGDTLTCSFGDLAKGESKSVHITSPTTAGSCTTYDNTATASADNQPSVTSPQASITVQCASISLTKTADAESSSAGDTIGFTIEVTNSGPGTAYGVTVTDTLPTNPGLNWSIDPAVAQCSITSGVLTCNVGTLPANKGFLVHISSPTTAATCGTVENSASVSTTNDGSAQAGDGITVNCPSLTVTKTADAASVDAGDVIGFTITVSNAGPGLAKSVTLTDTLPSGSGISWSIAGGTGASYCSINSGVLTCTFGDMASGASYNVHVTSPTDATSCGRYDNTATVTSSNQTNVTGTDSVTVNCASISITKTTSTPVVSAGDPISFTITVTNSGEGTAHGVTVTDVLPTNTGLDWSVNPVVTGCSITGGVLTCNLGDLAAHTSQTITLTSPTTSASCSTISNTASVTTSNDGSATSEPATITVACPDITVTKTAASGTISAGDPITFNITVTNTGTGTAKNVTLTDTLPTAPGLNWSVGGTDSAACSITAGVVTCDFGDLAPGAVKTITLTSPTTKDSCATIDNTATVTATNEPAGQPNNSSTSSVDVLCANITITKEPVPASGIINAGDPIAFNITVSNTGAGTAKNIVVTDTLPDNPGLSWNIVSISPVNISGTCQLNLIAPQTLICSFDQLGAGQSVTVQVSSPTTLATACSTINNTASVTTGNDGSGQASSSITVTCANIAITKEPVNTVVSAGDPIAYDIVVTNSGLSAASNVAVADTLPANPGLSWTISSLVVPPGTNGSCQLNLIAPQVLNCSFDQLAAGKSITIRISSPTSYATCGTVNNTASVTTGNDGSATSEPATITINCPALEVTKAPDTQTVSAGEPISFAIMVTNTGAGTAKNVTLNDQLPLGITWSVDNSACGVDANGLLTCGFGDLAQGDSASVTVTGDTFPAMCGTFDNTATIKLDNGPDAESNTVSVTVNCADITVTKEAVTGTINAGDTAAFKIVVSNIGMGTAYGVTLTDTLPAGVNWAVDPAVAECSISGTTTQTLSCSWASLAAGASVTINVSGQTSAANCGTLDNTATTAASNEPANQTNNQASASITINCSDITVTKEAVKGTIDAGEKAAFKIVVSNIGAGTAYNVTLTDTLPAGIIWTIDPVVTGCAITGNTLSCSWASLAAGASIDIIVSGDTCPAVCGKLDNTATAAASNEANTTNNTASASITVNCPADLTVTKTANPSFTRTFNWDITKNVDKTLVRQMDGSVTFNYSVTASETGFTDSNWQVTGQITVTNPNTWVDITANVTDVVDNGGTCIVTNGTNVTVPKGSYVVLNYVCTYDSAPGSYSGQNIATATWGRDFYHTPNGSASGTKDFAFDDSTVNNPKNINKTITVTDTFAGTLGTLTAVTATPYTTHTFTYSRTVPVPEASCQSYSNTAKIVETSQTASQTVTVCKPSLVTNSSLCSIPNNQFKLVFTPDQTNGWKLNASNPGQYYYNLFYTGSGNVDITMTLPYPFVTQGAVPIHIYSNVAVNSSGGITCLVPSGELASQNNQVTLASYNPQAFGSTTTVTVHIPAVSGGFAYINIHLDYGLKGTTGYAKGGPSGNDAVRLGTSTVLIPDNRIYPFSDTAGGNTSVTSTNSFKKDPGIGGLVQKKNLDGSLDDPIGNVKVLIYQGNKLMATVIADEDGWYMWQYKWTGKAASLTVKLPAYNLSQNVTLKANGYLVVCFAVP